MPPASANLNWLACAAMTLPATPSTNRAALGLLRFGVRALRITASSLAVVTLLQHQWMSGATSALAWLLILALPRVFPLLRDAPESTP
jgi:hypothetical protein